MRNQSPFLVTGPQRSGTTIFAEILQRHHDICLTVDGKLLYYLIVWLVNDPTARCGLHPRLDEIAHALARRSVKGDEYSRTAELIAAVQAFPWQATCDEDAFRAQVIRLWQTVYRSISNGSLAVGDKYNEYMLYAPEIHALFPGMKYIVLHRSTRESTRSAQNKFRGRPWQPRSQHLAEEKIANWRRVFDSAAIPEQQLFHVQFEHFCEAPRGTLEAVCDFLGLPDSEAMQTFASNTLSPRRARVSWA